MVFTANSLCINDKIYIIEKNEYLREPLRDITWFQGLAFETDRKHIKNINYNNHSQQLVIDFADNLDCMDSNSNLAILMDYWNSWNKMVNCMIFLNSMRHSGLASCALRHLNVSKKCE